MPHPSRRAGVRGAGAGAAGVVAAVTRAVARGAAVNLVAALAASFVTGCDDPQAGVGPAAAAPRHVAGAPRAAQATREIPDEYVVTLRDTVADVRGAAERLVSAGGGQLRHTYTHALRGFAAKLPPAAVEGLRRNPRVAAVEPDLILHEADVQLAPTWGLDRIDQRYLPLDRSYSYAATGAGVTAYILDGGIRFDHAEFGGRAVRGIDVIGDGMNGADCRGHGTHVAGTVGGRTWGVAKQVTLVSVRVMDCNGAGTVGGAIAGLDWVARNRRLPAVANMSIGAAKDEALNAAVRGVIAAGVQVSIAAGNSDADACGVSPASTPEAVVVGAAGTADISDRQPFSNWGSCVDLFAPGSLVMAASHLDATSGIERSGTSMAAPHAAGVMALWLEAEPALAPAQLHQLLVSNATQNVVRDAKGPNPHLLHAVRGPSAAPPSAAPPTAAFAASCTALSCAFDASGSAADGVAIVRYDWEFGDGGVAGGVTASRAYAASGTYAVTLTVTDARGVTGRQSRTVAVAAANRAPASAFTVACEGLACAFADQSSDTDGSVVAWAWSFGDGAASAERNPSHAFASPGTYTVRLDVTDDRGARSSRAQSVTVAAGVSLRATPFKAKGQAGVSLAWAGASGAQVVVYRNGTALGAVSNSGVFSDLPVARGTWRYRVCEVGGAVCSAEAAVQVR